MHTGLTFLDRTVGGKDLGSNHDDKDEAEVRGDIMQGPNKAVGGETEFGGQNMRLINNLVPESSG